MLPPGSSARVVAITGAASHVGRAIAVRMANRGDLVLMGDRDAAGCERLAARLRARGATAFAAGLDLADARSIGRFVEAAHYLIGEIDVLVTDVGLAEPDTLIGAQHLAAQVVPPMMTSGRGDVVLLGPDLLGPDLLGAPAQATAAHCGLESWVSALDAEFVGTGVRTSIVRPAPAGGAVAPDYVGRLVAAMTDAAEPSHLRVVEVIAAGTPKRAVSRGGG